MGHILKKRILKWLAEIAIGASLAVFPSASNETLSDNLHSSREQVLFSKGESKGINQAIGRYNKSYSKQSDKICVEDIERYVRNNLISEREMYEELKKEKVVIFGEVHCFTKQREKIVDIIKKIKSKDFVVGMEIFQTDAQGYIDKYLRSEMELEDLLSKTRYHSEDLKRRGYWDIIKFLKYKKIGIIGIDMPSSSAKTERIAPNLIKIIISRYDGYDFYSRDAITAGIVKENVDKGKNIAIIIGVGHAEKNHLPYMIRKIASSNSAIVSQQPYRIDGLKNPLNDYKRFVKFGLIEGKVLKIDNGDDKHKEFCLNTKPDLEEMAEYLDTSRNGLYKMYNQYESDSNGRKDKQ